MLPSKSNTTWPKSYTTKQALRASAQRPHSFTAGRLTTAPPGQQVGGPTKAARFLARCEQNSRGNMINEELDNTITCHDGPT